MTRAFEGKERKIAMTSEFELSEQLHSRSTRRVVVATGVKLAYAAPIVAASLKVSGVNAQAISPPAVSARTARGRTAADARLHLARVSRGNQCNDICGTANHGRLPRGPGRRQPVLQPRVLRSRQLACGRQRQPGVHRSDGGLPHR